LQLLLCSPKIKTAEMKDFDYELKLEVRDYECDLQGIVNNSVYQNYLEHTRHKYIKSIGLDFATLSEKGINLVVKRVEIDYQAPLHSGDKFVSMLRMERISPLRFGFIQHIYRTSDDKLMIKALVTGTALNKKGRPELPQELIDVWGLE
jgi:acyl-CoA thioester hydrolase